MRTGNSVSLSRAYVYHTVDIIFLYIGVTQIPRNSTYVNFIMNSEIFIVELENRVNCKCRFETEIKWQTNDQCVGIKLLYDFGSSKLSKKVIEAAFLLGELSVPQIIRKRIYQRLHRAKSLWTRENKSDEYLLGSRWHPHSIIERSCIILRTKPFIWFSLCTSASLFVKVVLTVVDGHNIYVNVFENSWLKRKR